MDKEKLNDAAEKYNKKLGKCRDVTWNDGEYGFIAGADWLMQQPLADRLTDEERKKVIEIYKDESGMVERQTLKIQESINPTCRQFYAETRESYLSRLRLLQSIFGKELFNEK